MLKRALKFFGIFLAALTFLFGAAFFYLYFNKAQLIGIFTAEVNKKLEARIDVGGINLSLKKFPMAAIAFERAVCYEPQPNATDTLFAFKEVYFQFSIWDLIWGNYDLRKITFEQGSANIRTLPDGRPNYQIWKTTEADEGPLQLELREVAFVNTRLRWTEGPLRIQKQVDRLSLKGHFDAATSQLELRSNGNLMALNYDGESFVPTSLPLQISLQLENRDEGLQIHSVALGLPGFEIKGNGFFGAHKNSFVGKATNFQLAELRSWLPQSLTESLKFWDLSGTGAADFAWAQHEGKAPQMEVNFQIQKGHLAAPDWPAALENLEVSGKYFSNGTTDKLQLSSASAQWMSSRLDGQLVLINLQKPTTSGSLNLTGSLADLKAFLPEAHQKTTLEGDMTAQLTFSKPITTWQKLQAEPMQQLQLSGTIQLANAHIDAQDFGIQWHNLQAALSLDGSDMVLEQLSFQTGASDLKLTGTLKNALAWLSPNGRPVDLDAQLQSKKLLFDDLKTLAAPGSAAPTSNGAPATELRWRLTAQVKNFVFDGLEGQQLTGALQSTANGFIGRDIRFQALEGTTTASFDWTETPGGYRVSNHAVLHQTNIPQLFAAFDNFGQNTLTAKHLEGIGNADIQWQMDFDKDLNPLLPTLTVTSNLKITNGRLKDFAPLQELSSFADVQELKDVRFATLQNNISIANERIIIPEMEIQSNLLGLSVMGTHEFSGAIDYSIKIRQGDLLAAKRKGKDLDDWITETGNANEAFLWVRMTGTTDQPKFGLNKEKNRAGLIEGWKTQGDALRDKTKQDPVKQQTKGYQFEWED
jgi:hypothetical protein